MPIIKQILVPTDFSRNSGQAIHYACDLAIEHKARLHLLHIGGDKGDDSPQLIRLAKMIEAHSEMAIDTVKKVIDGKPAEAIQQYAQDNEVDLIVMGTHGRTGFLHMTMGSVAEKVVREAPCPVLVLGPQYGGHVTMEHASKILLTAIGKGIEGQPETGRSQMYKILLEELRIPATTAILLIGELEEKGVLKYSGNKWTVVDEPNSRGDDSQFLPDFSSESAAVDIIKRARRLGATDIHLDPIENNEHVLRIRTDGKLREYCRLNQAVAIHLTNQLKSMANLDTADPFRAKEGHLHLPDKYADLDIRFTSIPVSGGQAVSLRLFDSRKIFLPLEHLGFLESAMFSINKMLHSGEGIILVTGPTGSGKTTTVYSMLQSVSEGNQNIVSIEDPVEYFIPFVRQISVDAKHGVTMSEGLKTVLRMDPDVIFVGEIRDGEAASMGMRAASSGKYVFSTMHTRDVASTITALRDFGLDDRTLSSNLTGIVNQRLIRRLCSECKQPIDLNSSQKNAFACAGIEIPEKVYAPMGCEVCSGSGYHGRIGIFEVVHFQNEIRDAISAGNSEKEVRTALRSFGLGTLEEDALKKVALGLINFDEATSVRWLS